MYATTTQPGSFSFHLRNSSGVIGSGERASRAQIGQQDDFLREQDRGRFRHEVHAAEDDDVGVGLRGGLRELERIGYGVGHFLDLGTLIMVRQQDRVALGAEFADALLLSANLFGRVGDVFDDREGVARFESFLYGTCVCHDRVLFPKGYETLWQISSARAECVSAPIEMASTPRAAYASTFDSEIPPLASIKT